VGLRLVPHAMTSLPIFSANLRTRLRISAKTALETALSSVPAYQTWRRYDRPSADIFARYQAMPVLTKADLAHTNLRNSSSGP